MVELVRYPLKGKETMKRFLLALLVIFVIAGALAGAGFAGYRFGYQRGMLTASNVEITAAPFARGHDFHWDRMPMDRFGNDMPRNFRPGFGPGRFRMMFPDRGFGFFSPIRVLIQVAFLGFIVWLMYKLLTGWRISLTRTTSESPRVEPASPVKSASKTDETTG
jgi:hypothetical protein